MNTAITKFSIKNIELGFLFLWLGIGAACTSCSRPERVEDALAEAQRVPLVKTMSVEPSVTIRKHAFTAFAKEGRTTRLSFRVPGPLVDFPVEIGRKVEKGTVLAKVDPRDYELLVAQVQAGLGEAHAALKAMKTGARPEDLAALEAMEVAAKSQLETAVKNEQRFANLLSTQSIPQIKYDEIKLLRDKAQAAYDAAAQQLEKGRKGSRAEEIEAMESKIAGLEVQLKKAQNALADTVLYAPSDGCVSQKFLENGEIAAPGIPVLVFTDTSTLLVETTIPESVLLEQARFEAFTCEFEAYPGVELPAKLHELGQALPSGKPGWPLVVEVESDARHPLHPGMTGLIRISITQPEKSIIVPLAALVGETAFEGEYDGKSTETCVWLVTQTGETPTVTKKPVVVARAASGGMEIRGEFQPQDRIVTAGARFLHEGERVRVLP
ncbi:MAG: efflux RND transporter periplasmic adaptor subunit [Planctomycetia bacterium]|nr:efflux RND transporter periplasmic adaptor subunit [Planctomycetia bacterium]